MQCSGVMFSTAAFLDKLLTVETLEMFNNFRYFGRVWNYKDQLMTKCQKIEFLTF